jgi:hypothetical protein
MRRLVVVLVLAAVVVGAVFLVRGGRHPHVRPVTTTTTAKGTMPLTTYFYRGNALVPVVVRVARTKAVATAALRALLAGPPPGYRTALRSNGLRAVAIANGVAEATFSRIAAAPRAAKAQIVYTLTQFPSVRGVVLSEKPGWKEYTLERRADYADLTPAALIFLASPLRDSAVSSPVRVTGTAVAFEATLALEVWSGGRRLRTLTVTASAGAPERGTWSQTLSLAPGAYRLVAYEPSAADGSRLHETSLDFRVKA